MQHLKSYKAVICVSSLRTIIWNQQERTRLRREIKFMADLTFHTGRWAKITSHIRFAEIAVAVSFYATAENGGERAGEFYLLPEGRMFSNLFMRLARNTNVGSIPKYKSLLGYNAFLDVLLS